MVAAALALAGCGNETKKAADLAHYRAEQRALVELQTMQSMLAAAQKAFDGGDAGRAAGAVADALDEHYVPYVRAPLADADRDLAASLQSDIGGRLRDELQDVPGDDDVDVLFEQIQTDLLTAADAIKA